MAVKVECDRCHKQAQQFINGLPDGWEPITIGAGTYLKSTRDLCKDCVEAFWKWITKS